MFVKCGLTGTYITKETKLSVTASNGFVLSKICSWPSQQYRKDYHSLVLDDNLQNDLSNKYAS